LVPIQDHRPVDPSVDINVQADRLLGQHRQALKGSHNPDQPPANSAQTVIQRKSGQDDSKQPDEQEKHNDDFQNGEST
jgi:hypothetical protein